MPAFSTFTPFGLLKFSADPSSAEVFYSSLRESQGGDDGPFRETGYQGAKLYAQAMGLARIKEFYDRIKQQQSASTVTYLFDDMELQHGIVPDSSLTEVERRDRLAIRMLGASALEDRLRQGLTQILGDDFDDIIMTDDPVFLDLVNNFPATPPSTANFRLPGEVSAWGVVSGNWGTNSNEFLYFPISPGDGSDPDDAFHPNDAIVFGSHNATILQKATVVTSSIHDEVNGRKRWRATLAANLTQPVENGQGVTSSVFPYFPTGRRRILVLVAASVAFDAHLVSRVHDFMHRNVRITTSWDLNIPQSPGFLIGESLLGFETFTDDP